MLKLLNSIINNYQQSSYYDDAPEYRIELKAPDWEIAESHWEKVEAAISETITADVGDVEISRR